MVHENDNARTALGFTVVIPAYKPQFLRAALSSLAAQTDSDFDTVVADDAGPPDIAVICSEFASRMRLRYHRFANNLGGSDLAAQWQRSVDLAATPWAMVLGDDDQLDPGGVAAFRQAVAAAAPEEAGDLYRFDTRRVDADGAVLGNNRPHLAFATCNDLIAARFHGRASYLNEFVFRVEALHRVGGFVSFPLGWSSDDATWILVGQRTGVQRIDGDAKVSWRLSGANISSQSDAVRQRASLTSGSISCNGWIGGMPIGLRRTGCRTMCVFAPWTCSAVGGWTRGCRCSRCACCAGDSAWPHSRTCRCRASCVGLDRRHE